MVGVLCDVCLGLIVISDIILGIFTYRRKRDLIFNNNKSVGLLGRLSSNDPMLHNIIFTPLVLILPKSEKKMWKEAVQIHLRPEERSDFCVSIVKNVTITQ